MNRLPVNRPGSFQPGYTLIEVVVAVAVFGLLAASAYVALDSLSRAAMEHRDRSAAFSQLQMAVSRMDADLRQVATRPVRGADGGPEAALSGQRSALAATRAGWANPSDVERSSLQRFAWQWSGDELVRVSWPVTDRVAATRARSETMLEEVRSVEFRYLDAQGRWRDQWPDGRDELDVLPRAVEIGIESRRFGSLRRLVVIQ